MKFETLQGQRILVTGGKGFLGRHVLATLKRNGAEDGLVKTFSSRDCDLRINDQVAEAVKGFDIVIHLAARVGGIGMNQKQPADLIYDNMMMGMNVIHQSHLAKVKKIVVAGTVCAYPKFTPVPFSEEDLWNGYPEETNAPYGVAKKALLVALQSYRQQHGLNGVFLLPTNLYGPHDNFDLETSHVIPALIRKFLEAKNSGAESVTVWGDGSPSREFLFVEDCAEGIVKATMNYDGADPINLGTNEEIKISTLIHEVRQVTGFQGEIIWDTSRPNGQPRRKLDTSKAKTHFGFEAKVPFPVGLKKTYDWYMSTMTEKKVSQKNVSATHNTQLL